VLEEAYAAGQWRLGDADPLMLLISHDLGVVAEELGNRHEARKAFGRVAGRGGEVLGADHWAVVRARAYLGADPATVRMDLSTPPPAPVQEPPTAPFPVVQQPAHGTPAAGAGTPDLTTSAGAQTHPGEGATEQPPTYGTPSTPYDVPRAAPTEPVRTGPPEFPGPAPVFAPGPPPAHPVRHVVSVAPDAAVGQGAERSAYAKKAPALFAAIAAVLAAVIAVVALIVVLAQRGDGGGDSNVPTLGGGPAPADVRLRDSGTSVLVSWRDPANGTTSFIVSGGRLGEVLEPMGQVSPGQTSFPLYGLNPDLDYCFAVVAVYSAKDLASSPQACTSRTKGSPRPSTTG
jgi:hypothetical protein